MWDEDDRGFGAAQGGSKRKAIGVQMEQWRALEHHPEKNTC